MEDDLKDGSLPSKTRSYMHECNASVGGSAKRMFMWFARGSNATSESLVAALFLPCILGIGILGSFSPNTCKKHRWRIRKDGVR